MEYDNYTFPSPVNENKPFNFFFTKLTIYDRLDLCGNINEAFKCP